MGSFPGRKFLFSLSILAGKIDESFKLSSALLEGEIRF
jgi:hypothetical protein